MSIRIVKEFFVGVGLTLVLFLIFTSSYLCKYFGLHQAPPNYEVTATFNRVDGLSVDSPIYLSGVPIGSVIALALLPDFRAQMRMSIEPGIRLPTDTSVAIQTDGLLGEKFVRLDPGGSEEYLRDGDSIEFSQDAVIVSELLELIISEAHEARDSNTKAN